MNDVSKCVYYTESGYCGAHYKKCDDFKPNSGCEPIWKECPKCSSLNTKWQKNLTPAFDEIGDEFLCLDCKHKFYKWA